MLNFKPLSKEDLPLRIKWFNNPSVKKNWGAAFQNGTDEAFHKKWLDDYFKDASKHFFTIYKEDTPIGQVGLVSINLLDKNACLYILIGEDEYRGKGLGLESVKFICDYGFNKLHLHKIWLEVHADNISAIKCYEKYGFSEEGRLKENIYRDGKYLDEVRMAIFNPKIGLDWG